MIKLIIFDWDDVFTSGSTNGYLRCYHEALESVGVHLTTDEEKKRILENWGKPVETEISGLLKERPDLVPKAVESYEGILMGNSFIDCLTVVEGAAELLTRLKDRYILAVATGINPILLKEKIMPKFDIPNVFAQVESVYYLDDPQKGKPHPFMVEKILKTQDIDPSEAILIGDAKNDVLMARSAGVEPVVVLTGHLTREEAQELEVKHIIPSVAALEGVLQLTREREH